MMRSVSLLLVGLTTIYAQTTVSPAYFGAPLPYAGPQYRIPVGQFVQPHAHVIAAAPRYVEPVPKVVAPQIRSGAADKDAHVVAEAREVSFDGNFNYGFDSDNGISVKSKGYLKPPTAQNEEPIQVIEGSYSYVDAYGKPQTIQYVADENGYRAYGEGIPQPSDAIQKSLAAQGQR